MNKRKKLVSLLAGIMAAVLLLSLIMGLIPAAHAASSGEIRNQINDLKSQQGMIQQQKQDLKAQYQQNEDEIADLVARKAIIDQEIFLLYEEIDIINEQINAFALLIADKQDELNLAQGNYDDLSREHRARIRTMEEDGGMSYWEVLFKANSFADLLDRLNMIQEIAAADRKRLAALTDAADLVAEAKTDLETEKESLEQTKLELDQTYITLDEKQQEARALLTELIKKGQEIEGMYEDFELEEALLMAEIAQKEKEYNEAKYQEWLAYIATATTATTAPPTTQPTTAPTTAPGTDPSEPTENQGGTTQPPQTEPEATEPEQTEPTQPKPPAATWIRPCNYVRLTSPFGDRDAPTAGASSNHQGVDLAGPEGTPIVASRGGTVTIARFSKTAGYYVTINHGDGFSSVYMHMTNYIVSVGQKVSQGQVIGYMGSTGVSTGSHLHFGIAYNGTYVNPALYVPLY